MSLVKVWNRNTYPFTQKFKGKEITIQPNKFVQMEFEDAYEFRGMFSPVNLDKDGNHDPRSYKMLEVEDSREPRKMEVTRFVHPLTGQEFRSKQELAAALAEVSDQVYVDELAEAEMKETSAEKRGRGRPKKDVGTHTT